MQLTKSQLRNLIKEELKKALQESHGFPYPWERKEEERKTSSDEARDRAISTLRELSKRVGDNDVTNFLVDVKGWINWTLGEKS